jgi:hypothetical protein
MSRHRYRLLAIFWAILAVSAATAPNASVLTYTAANCTGFTLGGVAPNQTLDCVGGVGGGTPASLALVDKNCSSFTLTGVAPDQVLVCNFVPGLPPNLVNAVSRKTQGAAGTFDLPLSLSPGN